MPNIATINGIDEDNIATYNGATASTVTSVLGNTWVHEPPIVHASLDALPISSRLWTGGRNLYGVGGYGSFTENDNLHFGLTQIGSETYWSQAYGRHGVAHGINSSRQLFSWGGNQNGQLGLGDTTNRNSPVQVGSVTDWHMIGGSYWDVNAIKSDGTLWGWGHSNDTVGSHGLGDNVSYSSPVQVGTGAYWWRLSGGGNFNTGAIDKYGRLWMWGINNRNGISGCGALGAGSSSYGYQNTPQQVGSLANWLMVACGYNSTIAIKTDGTAWAWGANVTGELGQGNTTATNSPVQIGSATDWTHCGSRGSYNTTTTNFLINSSGELWTCGAGLNGSTLQGNLTNISTFAQVGSLTNWKWSYHGKYHSHFYKTDGTLWHGGGGGWGEAGAGNALSVSSPQQIGSNTDWHHQLGFASSMPGNNGLNKR